MRRLLADRAAEIAVLLTAQGERDTGEVLAAELLPLADACRFLEREAARLLAPRRLGRAGRSRWLFAHAGEVHREPFGVVLVIGPDNYPLLLPGVPALQALAAGNAVLIKPAPGCALPMERLAALLSEAGLPDEVFQVLGEEPADARAAVEAGVDHVVLTGSSATGRAVLAALAPKLTPATLELSGNDAVFVLPGADIELAADALAVGLRFNSSATCIAPRRVFVGPAEQPPLEAALASRLLSLTPLPIKAKLVGRVQRMIGEAQRGGARFFPGLPTIADGRMSPTVIFDANPAWALLREDVFAPVLAVVPVADMTEALALDRQCPYALGAAVFGPEGEARKLATRVRAGSVIINDLIVPTADARLPFGGRGESGYGVTRGSEGLLAMTAVKTICVRGGRFRPHYALHETQADIVLAYLRAEHGSGPRARIHALASLISGLWRFGRR
jgi:acyl-CoA reductase-like NAD-dependent aldehyde dehydrogenase